MAKFNDITSIIIQKIYPVIETAMDKNTPKFKKMVGEFFNRNASKIYDNAPYDMIYFRNTDIDLFFDSIDIPEETIRNFLMETFYWKKAYRPDCAKEPYVIACMMIIRYFMKKKMEKEAELATIYLCFSGKIYASLFSQEFTKAYPSSHRPVMDFVVNNMLTNKYSLKTEGHVFGAIKVTGNTWRETYKTKLLGNPNDDEIGKLIQQLRERVRAFLYNIGKLYYEAYENKNYMNYETDNIGEDGKDFRLASSDMLRVNAATQKSMNYLINNSVSLAICNKCKDSNVKATEVQSIMDSILSDKRNIPEVERVVSILIADFVKTYPDKSINSVDFIAHSIKAKPNSQVPYIVELKSTILSWLDENSPNYRKRKSRKATALSYYRSVLLYLTLCIVYANK